MLVVAALAVATQAGAQMTGAAANGLERKPGMPAAALPAPLREVGFDQNLDQPLPLDIPFRDEHGLMVRLGDYFGARPVVLALVYYDCPMLCTQVLNGLARSLDVLAMDAGREFEVVTVSFDAREKPELALAKKVTYLERYKRHPESEFGGSGRSARLQSSEHREGSIRSEGWHFLTGDQPSIDRLTKAVGFRYVWDDRLKQFAHPTGVVVLTQQGRIARYLFGIEYGPRDLRFAIIDAAAGTIGSPVDRLLLYCYHYDPENGRYGFVIMRLLRIAGAMTVLALGTLVFVMIRRDRSVQRAPFNVHSALNTPAHGNRHPTPGTR
jgi:protein SCO1/2